MDLVVHVVSTTLRGILTPFVTADKIPDLSPATSLLLLFSLVSYRFVSSKEQLLCVSTVCLLFILWESLDASIRNKFPAANTMIVLLMSTIAYSYVTTKEQLLYVSVVTFACLTVTTAALRARVLDVIGRIQQVVPQRIALCLLGAVLLGKYVVTKDTLLTALAVSSEQLLCVLIGSFFYLFVRAFHLQIGDKRKQVSSAQDTDDEVDSSSETEQPHHEPSKLGSQPKCTDDASSWAKMSDECDEKEAWLGALGSAPNQEPLPEISITNAMKADALVFTPFSVRKETESTLRANAPEFQFAQPQATSALRFNAEPFSLSASASAPVSTQSMVSPPGIWYAAHAPSPQAYSPVSPPSHGLTAFSR